MARKFLSPSLLFFILFMSILFTKLSLLGSDISQGIMLTNTLDLSWQTDSVERLLHGYITGRDFIFTYGPLFQILYSLPALVLHQPSYIAILYAPILLTLINSALLIIIITLTIRKMKTALTLTAVLFFIVGLLSFDQNTLFRTLLPFFYGLLLLRCTSLQILSIKTVFILSLPALFGLYTFDLFFLGLLITILFVCYQLILVFRDKKLKKHLKRYIFQGTTMIVVVFLFEFLVSLFLSGGLHYFRYSLDTVQNYQFVMGIPWSLNNNLYLFIFPLALCFLLFYCLKKTNFKKEQKIACVTLTIIALLQLKSAFIRADDGHIVMGIYPSLIIFFTLLFFLLYERFNWILLGIAVLFFIMIPVKNNYLQMFSAQNLTIVLSHITTNTPFFSVYKLPANYYFSETDFEIFGEVIKNNPGNVMVYPYDTYILNAFGQTYNTVGLQMYQYSNSLVETKTVEELTKSFPQYIILGIDTKGAVQLDNIPNFSRNPILAKWMIQNYSVEKKADNYLILRFDANKTGAKKLEPCTMYDINTNEIMDPNIFERILKPSTYYLNTDSGIRLPYMPETKEILIVEQYNDSNSLQKLFESNINFEEYKTQKKKLKIIKKSSIPLFKQIYEMEFSMKCYS